MKRFFDRDEAVTALKGGRLSQAEIALAIEYLAREEGVNSAKIADLTGIPRSNVRHYVRMPGLLDPEVFDRLHRGQISQSIARVLAGLQDKKLQRQKAQEVYRLGKSVEWLRKDLGRKAGDRSKRAALQDHFDKLATMISEQTGLSVSIEADPDSKTSGGTMMIKFVDMQDWDVIQHRLRLDLSEL